MKPRPWTPRLQAGSPTSSRIWAASRIAPSQRIADGAAILDARRQDVAGRGAALVAAAVHHQEIAIDPSASMATQSGSLVLRSASAVARSGRPGPSRSVTARPQACAPRWIGVAPCMNVNG